MEHHIVPLLLEFPPVMSSLGLLLDVICSSIVFFPLGCIMRTKQDLCSLL